MALFHFGDFRAFRRTSGADAYVMMRTPTRPFWTLYRWSPWCVRLFM
ncbi:hypothetical protein APY03_1269 [Variovorax sp. WDL1]|nr:hypothetical protein APY03_1269 [Variovorax sp. WDL1]